MKEMRIGEIFSSDLPPFIFSLPQDMCFIWRDTPGGVQSMLWEPLTVIPAAWKNSSYLWKIIGEEKVVTCLWATGLVPMGSKSIVTKGLIKIKVDFSKRSLQWQGKRLKRVLIVDDSNTMRKILKQIIDKLDDWKVVSELDNAEELPIALDSSYPDLVTLDLNLKGMNGLQAMKLHLAKRKIPTILITSQSKEDGTLVMDTLAAGALEYLQKPESGKWDDFSEELNLKMESCLKSKWQVQNNLINSWKPLSQNFNRPEDYLIVIGSSTGGTQALQDIFLKMPKNIPPILVTQHIPPYFSQALAERFNSLCPFEVKEAQDQDEVLPNRILIAPGGKHLSLAPGGKTVRVTDEEAVNRFRPSVDVLFNSVAQNAKVKVMAALLTGMGKDGAQGLLNLKNKGAYTIAQDEETSVVFGMPKEAIALGAAIKIAPLDKITEILVEQTQQMPFKKSANL